MPFLCSSRAQAPLLISSRIELVEYECCLRTEKSFAARYLLVKTATYVRSPTRPSRCGPAKAALCSAGERSRHGGSTTTSWLYSASLEVERPPGLEIGQREVVLAAPPKLPFALPSANSLLSLGGALLLIGFVFTISGFNSGFSAAVSWRSSIAGNDSPLPSRTLIKSVSGLPVAGRSGCLQLALPCTS